MLGKGDYRCNQGNQGAEQKGEKGLLAWTVRILRLIGY